MYFDSLNQCPVQADQALIQSQENDYDAMLQADFNEFNFKRRGSSLLRRAASARFGSDYAKRDRSPDSYRLPVEDQSEQSLQLKSSSPLEDAKKDAQIQIYIA